MSEAVAIPRAVSATQAAVAVSPLIRMEGVTKTYDAGELAVQALRGVDLAIEAGQMVAIIGPSGPVAPRAAREAARAPRFRA